MESKQELLHGENGVDVLFKTMEDATRLLMDHIPTYVQGIPQPIRAFSGKARPQHDPELMRRVRRASEWRGRLISLKDDLDAMRTVIATRENSVHNALAPITSLPNEVLSVIFKFLTKKRRIYQPEFRDLESITHVCYRWREVALQNANLWTTIDFLWCEGRFSTWSLRAKSMALDVHVCTLPDSAFLQSPVVDSDEQWDDRKEDVERIKELVSLRRSCLSRACAMRIWMRFSRGSHGTNHDANIHDILLDAAPSDLHTLYIEYNDFDDPRAMAVTEENLPIHLQMLSITRFDEFFPTTRERLTHLTLTEVFLIYSDLDNALRSFPSLEYLKISRSRLSLSGGGEVLSSPGSVHLKALKHLIVEHSWSMEEYFPIMHLPALRRLEITGYCNYMNPRSENYPPQRRVPESWSEDLKKPLHFLESFDCVSPYTGPHSAMDGIAKLFLHDTGKDWDHDSMAGDRALRTEMQQYMLGKMDRPRARTNPSSMIRVNHYAEEPQDFTTFRLHCLEWTLLWDS